ncbi:MAG: hypothetical protein ACOX8N_05110 [Christensenellales bacterium]|jgi:hypothetical protein
MKTQWLIRRLHRKQHNLFRQQFRQYERPVIPVIKALFTTPPVFLFRMPVSNLLSIIKIFIFASHLALNLRAGYMYGAGH